MGHGHQHIQPALQDSRPLKRAYVISIALNLSFVVLEFVVGRMSHSLGLISDAGHKLFDVIALVVALIGFRLARRPAADARRISAVIALVNTAVLLFTIIMIVAGGIERLAHPTPVDGDAITWTAAAGILVSGLSAWLLMRHQGDINTRAAFLHMAADSFLSLGVVISGIVISATGWQTLDPIISLIVAAVILANTLKLLKDALHDLFE